MEPPPVRKKGEGFGVGLRCILKKEKQPAIIVGVTEFHRWNVALVDNRGRLREERLEKTSQQLRFLKKDEVFPGDPVPDENIPPTASTTAATSTPSPVPAGTTARTTTTASTTTTSTHILCFFLLCMDSMWIRSLGMAGELFDFPCFYPSQNKKSDLDASTFFSSLFYGKNCYIKAHTGTDFGYSVVTCLC